MSVRPDAMMQYVGSGLRGLFDRLPGLRPAWLVLALSLAATVLSTWVSYRSSMINARGKLEAETRYISEVIGDVMTTYGHILRAGVGLFNATDVVTDEEWKSFVDTLDLEQTFPGVLGLGVSIAIKPEQLEAHIKGVRRGGRPKYTVTPEGPRDLYTSIVYIEPLNEVNKRAIGFDMFSEPVRQEAMTAARNSGEARLTRMVTLVQDTPGHSQPGLLMYLPFYQTDAVPRTEAERIAQHEGYVYAAFRMQQLFDEAVLRRIPDLLSTIRIRVYDSPRKQGGQLLLDSAADKSEPSNGWMSARLITERVTPIAGQTWEIEYYTRPAHASSSAWKTPALILFIGSLITLSVTAIAATLAVARSQAVMARRNLEREVLHRKQAQEEATIANRELIHRVKNMFAVVSSIAAQTARFTPEPEEFSRVFRDRLAALGRVQDLLKPNPSFMPDLVSLIPAVLEPYSGSEKQNLKLEGPSVGITQSSAVMLSLVLNELATNAVKFGAWSVPNGRVSLRWWYEQRDETTDVVLDWQEKGGPAVNQPTRKGFGSQVLTYSVQRGLKGTFEPRYHDDGFSCVFRFPVTDSTDPATALQQ